MRSTGTSPSRGTGASRSPDRRSEGHRSPWWSRSLVRMTGPVRGSQRALPLSLRAGSPGVGLQGTEQLPSRPDEDADARGARPAVRARAPHRVHRAGHAGAVTAARGDVPRRLPALDGVRGLAMALVFLHHVVVRDQDPVVDGAWIGVDLFFVLSGFLITVSMLSKPDLGDFLRRRFWRIAPAMVVFLAAYVLWSLGADDVHQRLVWAFAALTQWANVQGAIGPPFSPHIGHLWSLSAEVQFYVLWGACLWWLLRRGVSRGVILGGVVAVFVLTEVERLVLLDRGAMWNRLYLGPDTRAAALLVGCVLGLAYTWGWLRQPRVLTALVLPAVALMVWFIVELTFLDDRVYRWALALAALAWGVVVASAALRLPTPVRPLLEWRPLAWLGRISYSVYLWHLAIIAVVAEHHPDDPLVVALIAAPITLGIGWISYRVVERPLLSSTGRARLLARLA